MNSPCFHKHISLPQGLVQWLETVGGAFHPAIKWNPSRIGIRQLIVSTLWTILFIVTWRRRGPRQGLS